MVSFRSCFPICSRCCKRYVTADDQLSGTNTRSHFRVYTASTSMLSRCQDQCGGREAGTCWTARACGRGGRCVLFEELGSGNTALPSILLFHASCTDLWLRKGNGYQTSEECLRLQSRLTPKA